MNIALISIDTRLPGEVGGIDRFPYLANLLCERGHNVDLITSSFQHWQKQHHALTSPAYNETPYRIMFVDQPGYGRNICFSRIYAHRVAARNIIDYLEGRNPYITPPEDGYDLLYVNIPPNNIAYAVAKFAEEHNVPIIGDVNDLWPEAMRMVLDVPLVSNLLFLPFTRQANGTYNRLTSIVGTSGEYAEHYRKYVHDKQLPTETVYVGIDVAAFDEATTAAMGELPEKTGNECWITYAGTLGASYDIETVLRAVQLIRNGFSSERENIRLKILGDGPERKHLEAFTAALSINDIVDYTGYVTPELAGAYMRRSDIVLNTFVKKAPQSIPTKIADYLASGTAIINTCPSQELRKLLDEHEAGVNVAPEAPMSLAERIRSLLGDKELLAQYGVNARQLAEQKFDRRNTYPNIAALIEKTAIEHNVDSNIEN